MNTSPGEHSLPGHMVVLVVHLRCPGRGYQSMKSGGRMLSVWNSLSHNNRTGFCTWALYGALELFQQSLMD